MFRDDEDEDSDDGVIVDQQNSQLNKFLSSKTLGGGKKGTKGTVCTYSYNFTSELYKSIYLKTLKMSNKHVYIIFTELKNKQI